MPLTGDEFSGPQSIYEPIRIAKGWDPIWLGIGTPTSCGSSGSMTELNEVDVSTRTNSTVFVKCGISLRVTVYPSTIRHHS